MARKVTPTNAVHSAPHISPAPASRRLPVTHPQISAAVLAERGVSSQGPGVGGNLELSK